VPRAILIAGPMNAGKTTLCRLLVRRLPAAAHVEVDALRRFVPWMPLEESLPLDLANAASVAVNFLRAGLDVVIDTPLRAEQYERLVAALAPHAEAIHAFVLAPPLQVASRDRGERALSARERQRIRELYAERLHAPGFGTRVDNADQTPEETLALVLRALARPADPDA
jgi:hypothetical protein